LGVIEDTRNQKKLLKLLRFKSSRTADDEYVSLEEYVEVGKLNDVLIVLRTIHVDFYSDYSA
jgi:HSP90 family molecular chaperone